MKMRRLLLLVLVVAFFMSCKQEQKETSVPPGIDADKSIPEPENTVPFVWESANIYFMLTDRFNNGNKDNDINFQRTNETGVLRGFMGGDLAGITQKIENGYFTDLGINAIWFTPVVEQVHGDTDESTGNTYGYHGYWTKDWTSLDPNFGTKKELENLVKTAHKNGIRVLMDVVLNHTGPVTKIDSVWPDEWVRTEPTCEFTTYENTTACTLVDNLPDIYTESEESVELPDALLAKWKEEGRLSTELDELQLFFERTGYPRAPRFYIMKWLTDYVNDMGIDGFRVDTVKHVNENAWAELFKEASSDFGDKKVDFFNHGFKSLINFELKRDADKDYETIFKKYSKLLHTKLQDKSVVNYLTSHDDGEPYDKERKKPIRSANVLLLTPGASQVYYGDESSRDLTIEGAEGDATLRSFMNWEDQDSLPATRNILSHWQKLGTFRRDHPAIGAGKHKRLAKKPYVFSRTYIKDDFKDKVVIGLDLPKGKKSLWVKGFFGDGTKLYDTYSDTVVEVKNGKVVFESEFDIALLEVAH